MRPRADTHSFDNIKTKINFKTTFEFAKGMKAPNMNKPVNGPPMADNMLPVI